MIKRDYSRMRSPSDGKMWIYQWIGGRKTSQRPAFDIITAGRRQSGTPKAEITPIDKG